MRLDEVTLHKHQRHMFLFPTSGSLPFAAIYILGLLPKMKNRNQLLILIKYRYTTMTRAIPVARTSEPNLAAILLDNWVLQYGTPTHLLKGAGRQLVGKFFPALCAFNGTKNLSSATYDPQTIGQTGMYKNPIVSRPLHYVSGNQSDWEK